MNPTERAKRRASGLQRPGARPVAPEHRINVNMDPSAVQGSVQGAQAQQPPIQGQQPPMQQQSQPQEDKPQPRSKGEVNSDLHAYGEALRQSRERETEGEVKEEPEKSKDGYSADEEYEALWGSNDKLNNTTRRKRIEGRCEKMSLDEYILSGGVKQRVPIVPRKVEVTYRTAGVDEDLEVKRKMYGLEGTDIFVTNTFSLMQVALSLYAFNGEPLPSHLDASGKFNEDLFDKKVARIKKYPTQLAEDLVNNYMWFDERVKDLLNEDLGNG